MKLGIIVYSETGHTRQVAMALAETLTKDGHSVQLEEVVADSAKPNETPILLKAPDPSVYDGLIFASPVQGFSLAPAMRAYLSSIANVSGKRVFCFLTQHFKKAWLGGNRSMRQMKEFLLFKGAAVNRDGIVHWSAKDRDKQIEALIDQFVAGIREAGR